MLSAPENAFEPCPFVSVIIPAYNVSASIARCIDSVIGQTYQNLEILVINDGSSDTDQLEEVLSAYMKDVIYLRQDNQGAAAARNNAIKAARGQWVAFLDADDYWLPNYLDRQLRMLNSSGADVVYCDAHIAGDTPLIGNTFIGLAPSRSAVTPESLLAVDVGILTSAVVARRDRIVEVGLFDEDIRRGHDFELWLRLAKAGAKFICNREILLYYNISETGLSGNASSQLHRTIALMDRIESDGNLTPTELAALSRNRNKCLQQLAIQNGKAQLVEQDFRSALQSFIEANKIKRSWKLTIVCWCLKTAPQMFWHLYRGRAAS